MEFQEIHNALLSALDKMNENDRFLLDHDVSERSIAHVLAIYLSQIFGDYHVDCEYNSDIESDTKRKRIHYIDSRFIEIGGNQAPDSDELRSRSVFPDIIVHIRGKNGPESNKLAIEIKKSSSTESHDYDRIKLSCYTSKRHGNNLRYLYGAFVVVGVKEEAAQHEIYWFANGDQCQQGRANKRLKKD